MNKEERERTESLLDELVETTFKPNGEVEVKTVEGDAKEMREAADELAQAWKRFRDFDTRHPGAALDPEHALHWWRLCEFLMLANNRTKEALLGRDRSPRSVRQHEKFRRTLLLGERCKADA